MMLVVLPLPALPRSSTLNAQMLLAPLQAPWLPCCLCGQRRATFPVPCIPSAAAAAARLLEVYNPKLAVVGAAEPSVAMDLVEEYTQQQGVNICRAACDCVTRSPLTLHAHLWMSRLPLHCTATA